MTAKVLIVRNSWKSAFGRLARKCSHPRHQSFVEGLSRILGDTASSTAAGWRRRPLPVGYQRSASEVEFRHASERHQSDVRGAGWSRKLVHRPCHPGGTAPQLHFLLPLICNDSACIDCPLQYLHSVVQLFRLWVRSYLLWVPLCSASRHWLLKHSVCATPRICDMRARNVEPKVT